MEHDDEKDEGDDSRGQDSEAFMILDGVNDSIARDPLGSFCEDGFSGTLNDVII